MSKAAGHPPVPHGIGVVCGTPAERAEDDTLDVCAVLVHVLCAAFSLQLLEFKARMCPTVHAVSAERRLSVVGGAIHHMSLQLPVTQ